MTNERETEIITEAEEMVEKNVDFRIFHNHFFSQTSSLLKGLSKEQREDLVAGNLYSRLTDLETQLGIEQGFLVMDLETGTAVEKEYSGIFNMRVAKTLHKELVIEAKREGVPLNSLCVLKLSQPLKNCLATSA